jgi:hypothetical protein
MKVTSEFMQCCQFVPCFVEGNFDFSTMKREYMIHKNNPERVPYPRIYHGPKKDEIIGGWGELHNEELHNLYSLPSIIRMIKSRVMRWGLHVARIGKRRTAYRVLVEKPEGKAPLGRPRHKWEDNVNMNLREMGWGDIDWILLVQDRDQQQDLVTTIKCREILE